MKKYKINKKMDMWLITYCHLFEKSDYYQVLVPAPSLMAAAVRVREMFTSDYRFDISRSNIVGNNTFVIVEPNHIIEL